MLTGPKSIPVQVQLGFIIHRNDLEIFHEEADLIITNQTVHLMSTEIKNCVHVLCTDTDVFVLLLHYYQSEHLSGTLIMRPFNDSDPCADIGLTVQKHAEIIPRLVSLHALTHCDSVPAFHRIGKPTALKILKQGIEPPALGIGFLDMSKATTFISLLWNNFPNDEHDGCLNSSQV